MICPQCGHHFLAAALQNHDFDLFWAQYPRKIGKQAAFRAYQKAKGIPDIGLVLEALSRAKASEQWRRDNGRYIPHPATWLNQGRWMDEHPVPAPVKATPPPFPPKNDPIARGQWRAVYGDPQQYGYNA